MTFKELTAMQKPDSRLRVCLRAIGLFLAVAIVFLPFGVQSATLYVDNAAPNDAGKGTEASPKKYISSGLRLLSRAGGDTLVLRKGRYDTPLDAILRTTPDFNGVAGKPNTIRAEVDGAVSISAGINLPLSSANLVFEGIKWDGQSPKAIAGANIRFLRCAFKDGLPSGNHATLAIGTNDQFPGASQILIEDSWVYGEGGRYRLLVYNAEKVILRRLVVRHDGGWSYDGRNPQGGVAVYNTQHVELQNVMLVDNDLALPGWEAALYIVKNTSKGSFDRHIGTRVRGSMLINTRERAIGIEGWGKVEDVRFEDLLIWKAGQGLSFNNDAHEAAIKSSTIGQVGGPAFAIWGRQPSRLEVRQTLIHDAQSAFQADAGIIDGEFNACSRTRKCSTRSSLTIDALASGLVYPLRVESGSKLHSAGPSGAAIGANIETRIGKLGSMYGDNGYNVPGQGALWPWPFEERIKRDLCEGPKARGFCKTDLKLSEYVWGQLGNARRFPSAAN